MNSARQQRFKTVLWAIIGVFGVVTVARFASGLGTTTGLSDTAPWGLWIAFDVMAGVALAAGGFVFAGAVYILHLERYRPYVRPAVLTALLGYGAVAVGLLYDIGLPWHIYHPLIYPQPHSVLFEVAMCVMFYLAVLLLEFTPVILEHPWFDKPIYRRILAILKKLTIPLVITGIVLSTLHQSSLGSLFLIAPYRLHPLWYSSIIWVLFFVSAIGLGCATVILESFFSRWFFRHHLRMDLLSNIGRVTAWVLLLYGAVRVLDVASRGVLPMAFDGSFLGGLFVFEILLSSVVPGLLLLSPKVRGNPYGLGFAALAAAFGIVGYRFNVCLVAFYRPEGMTYFPTWTEIAVTVGIVAGAILVFIWLVQTFRVFVKDGSEEAEAAEESAAAAASERTFEPHSTTLLLPESQLGLRRYTLAALMGAALAVAFLPHDALFGASPVPTPVSGPRVVDGATRSRQDGRGRDLFLSVDSRASAEAVEAALMAIDGNRNGRMVLFDHDHHAATLGGFQACKLCHHLNQPFQRNTACSSCHRDMFSATDIFDHNAHVGHLGGNEGCARCHDPDDGAKTRQTATSCTTCHEDMLVEGTRVDPPASGLTGIAPAYMDALHGLCVKCHAERAKADADTYQPGFAECRQCHRDTDGNDLRRQAPFNDETEER